MNTVRGIITGIKDNKGAVTVKALYRTIRGEASLGEALTAANGRYEINFEQPSETNNVPVTNVFIRVFSSTGQLLAESRVYFNISENICIDLEITGDDDNIPEFEALKGRILRHTCGLKLSELKSGNDYTFIASSAGISEQSVDLLSRSFRVAEKTGLRADILYGLKRKNVEIDPEKIALNPLTIIKSLEAAEKSNIIAPLTQTEKKKAAEKLVSIGAKAILKRTLPGTCLPIGRLLEIAVQDEATAKKISLAYFKNSYPKEDVFVKKEILGNPDLKPYANSVKFLFKIGTVLDNHIPLIEYIYKNKIKLKIKTDRCLARFGSGEWEGILEGRLVNGIKIDVPENIQGEDREQKVKNYAEALAQKVEECYPTESCAYRLVNSDKPHLKRFFSRYLSGKSGFNIMATDIDSYFKASKNAAFIAEMGDEAGRILKKELKNLQRMYKLTRSFHKAQAFLDDGVVSNYDLVCMPKERYLEKYSVLFGSKDAAESIYDKAKITAELASSITAAELAERLNTVGSIPRNPEIPQLENLFGAFDLCKCEDWRTVLSPAAYLTDILHFLQNRLLKSRNANGDILLYAAGELFARRPDIAQILLDRENSFTPIPYIDLVNEILENILIAPLFCLTLDKTQSRAAVLNLEAGRMDPVLTDKMAIGKEYLSEELTVEKSTRPDTWICRDRKAGTIFTIWDASKQYPSGNEYHFWVSKFYQTAAAGNKPAAEPEHSNIRAYEALRDKVFPFELPFDLQLEEIRLCLGKMDLQRNELIETFITQNTGNGRRTFACEYLGMTSAEWDILSNAGTCSLSKLWGCNNPKTQDVINEFGLNNVRVLLKKSALKYEQLEELLKTYYVNPNGSIFIQAGKPEDEPTCDITKLVLENLDYTGLLHIHKLIRLSMRTGWDYKTVDRVVTGLVGENGEIDGDTLINIAYLKKLTKDLKTDVIKVLSWYTLIDTGILSLSSEAENEHLYSKVFESSAVTELRPSGLNVFKLNNKRDQLKSFEESIAKHVQVPKLTDAANKPSVLAALSITETELTLLVDGMSSNGMMLIRPYLPDTDLNIENLSRLYRIVTLSKALKLPLNNLLRILDLTGIDPFKASERFVPAGTLELIESVRLIRASGMSLELLEYLLRNITYAGLKEELSVEKSAIILGELRSGLGKIYCETYPDSVKLEAYTAYIAEKFAAAFQSDVEITRALVESHLKVPGGNDKILNAFTDEGFILSPADKPVPCPDFKSQYASLLLVYKAALIITGYKTNKEMIESTSKCSARYPDNILNFNLLPVFETECNKLLYKSWEGLERMMNLAVTLPGGEDAVKLTLEYATNSDSSALQDYLDKLCLATGWDAGNLGKIFEICGLNTGLFTRYADGTALDGIEKCMSIAKSMGISCGYCIDWCKESGYITQEDARTVKRTLKARYGDDVWPDTIGGISDILREKKRNALVKYHIAYPQMKVADGTDTPLWESESDLYRRFLIDVEMSSKMITTRMKQATSSVQLFVQRCFMNLERPVLSVDLKKDPEWVQWKWMKNYRVWEANRKVFLYPENWIEADLRKDKSPFFKEFENELMQGEVTDEAAEAALFSYLEKLDAVSRLEISSFYNNSGSGELHVLARTKNAPHIYYYRKLVNGSFWTPWEKVGLDIEGNYVQIISWMGRLYIFWLMVNEKAVADDYKYKTEGLQPLKALDIKLAYSEFKNGKWQSKKVNPQAFDLAPSECLSRYRTYCSDVCTHCLDFRACSMFNMEDVKKRISFSVEANDYISISVEYIKKYYDAATYSYLYYHSIKSRSISIEFDGIRFINGYETNADNKFAYNSFPWTAREYNKFVYVGNAEFYPFNTIALCPPSSNYSTSATAMLSFNNASEYKGAYYITLSRSNNNMFFIEDNKRTYFVTFEDSKYVFRPFYHAFTWLFSSVLAARGIEGLMDRRLQLEPAKMDKRGKTFCFYKEYGPNPWYVSPAHPKEDIDFSFEGAYSIYNWEIFFHIPMLIAGKLGINSRFEEAGKWYNYIFDPTDISEDIEPPERYWKTRPFTKPEDKNMLGLPIQQLLVLLARKTEGGQLSFNEKKMLELITQQIRRWRSEAFNPHLIARLRLSAYQKSIVMKYIDNLISWGDSLFRQDTMESVNEAAQLYVMAALILGDRPELIPPRFRATSKTYDYLSKKMGKDDFSDPLVEAENLIIIPEGAGPANAGDLPAIPNVPRLPILYFGVPHNDKLMRYWETVSDRLYKIRNCLNIEGVERVLSLFEPPIDPGLLVKAAASGLDIGSVISEASAPMPYYRFIIMSQRALELCGEVKSLGSAMLLALEKRDAEKLSLIKSSHEIEMLNALCTVKEKSMEEAKQQVEALKLSKALATIKQDYYANLPFMNENEKKHLAQLKSANDYQMNASECQKIAQYMAMIPDFVFGASGIASPVVEVKFGGTLLSLMCQAESTSANMGAISESYGANKSSTMGTYNRRQDEWRFNKKLADKEIEQLDKQVAAAEIRVAFAEKELENLKLQIENAQDEETFMKDKFTNLELYDWMTAQIAAIYFQAYKMAFDMAKKAERTFQYELSSTSGFIQFGCWDSLKKGLLTGEKLYHDVKRMELAYMEQNSRDYEITKHVSLALLDPLALLNLKLNGECFITLPEWLFDMDYPGHYMRRIKNVSVSIPCITGPYTGVNCRLTLNSSSVRTGTSVGEGYQKVPIGDERFLENPCSVQSIVTSSGQNDSGLFETQMRDERYLPFEGAGAISSWRVVLDPESNSFDLKSVSDVIIHLRYTAKEGGDDFKTTVKTATAAIISEAANLPITRLLSIKNLFSSEWLKLQTATNGQAPQLKLDITNNSFPYIYRNKTFRISAAQLLFIPSDVEKASALGTIAVSRMSADGVQIIDNCVSVTHPDIAHAYMAELNSLKGTEISRESSIALTLKFSSAQLQQVMSAAADTGLLLQCTIE